MKKVILFLSVLLLGILSASDRLLEQYVESQGELNRKQMQSLESLKIRANSDNYLIAKISQSLVNANDLTFLLPGNHEVLFSRTELIERNGKFVWKGVNGSANRAVIVENSGGIRGNIFTPRANYEIFPLSNGYYLVIEDGDNNFICGNS